MRWKPLDQRQPPAFFMWMLAAVTSPVWTMLIALLWLDRKKAQIFGPSKDWQRWYAWHPVRVWGNNEPEHTVWLEYVWRRRLANEIDYATKPTALFGDDRHE